MLLAADTSGRTDAHAHHVEGATKGWQHAATGGSGATGKAAPTATTATEAAAVRTAAVHWAVGRFVAHLVARVTPYACSGAHARAGAELQDAAHDQV